MRTVMAAVLVAVCSYPVLAQDAGVPYELRPPAQSVHRGSYEVTRFDTPGEARFEVRVLGPTQEHVADATVVEKDSKQMVTIAEPGKARVVVMFDRPGQALTVRVGRRVGRATVVPEKGWSEDAMMKQLKATYARQIALAGAVLTDVVETPRRQNRKQPDSGVCSAPAEGDTGVVIAARASYCQGSSCRGQGIGSSRGLCCSEAAANAGSCCWNQYCVGCCSWEGNAGGWWEICDASCFLGDYWCFCGVTGYKCSSSPS